MKTIAVLALFCAISDLAFAQAPECPPTPRAGDLINCYNRTAPLPALGKPARSKVRTALDKTAVSDHPTDPRAQVNDILAVENNKLDAKLKTICRGC